MLVPDAAKIIRKISLAKNANAKKERRKRTGVFSGRLVK